jgi:hypothetical protein
VGLVVSTNQKGSQPGAIDCLVVAIDAKQPDNRLIGIGVALVVVAGLFLAFRPARELA